MLLLGNNAVGADEDTGAMAAAKGSRFTAVQSGTLVTIWVYVLIYFGGALLMRAALYAVSGGRPGAKIAESPGAASITGDHQWFGVGCGGHVVAGVDYFLIGWMDSGNADPVSRSPGDTASQSTAYSGGTFPTWADPFTEDGGSDKVYSIYGSGDPDPASGIIIPSKQHVPVPGARKTNFVMI